MRQLNYIWWGTHIPSINKVIFRVKTPWSEKSKKENSNLSLIIFASQKQTKVWILNLKITLQNRITINFKAFLQLISFSNLKVDQKIVRHKKLKEIKAEKAVLVILLLRSVHEKLKLKIQIWTNKCKLLF